MLPRLTAGLVLVATLLAGCGDAVGVDPVPAEDVSAEGSPVRLVDESDADLVLWVSNQSFEDEEVRLRVAVDGVGVVDDDFHVEGQHNWIQFPLQVGPGDHEITAEADSGATLDASFRVPRHGRRYAVVDHWTYDEEPPELTWHIQRRPMAFA